MSPLQAILAVRCSAAARAGHSRCRRPVTHLYIGTTHVRGREVTARRWRCADHPMAAASRVLTLREAIRELLEADDAAPC